MEKSVKNTEIYIMPEKARDKLQAAQKIRQTVYIFGVTSYGKTALIQHYLKNSDYYYLDASSDPEEKFQIAIGEHKIVVVDNLQFAEPQEVREAIAGLTARKDFWLILSARCPLPEWMVTSFVRNGPFMVIEEKDLAMTEKNIRKFFQEYGIYTDDESIRQIQKVSLGHPLYMKVAAMQMELQEKRDGDTASHFTEEVYEKTERIAWSYVEQEVYERWDSELLEFIMQMCVVDSFTVQMAEQLTGLQNAGALIRKVEMTGNFMRKKNEVYTFVPQFLSSMRTKMEKDYSKEKLKRLYYNAGRIYVKENQVMKALEMFERSGDKEQIRDLLVENVRLNPGAGYLYELRKYYLSLSEEYIAGSMELMAGMSMLQSLLLNVETSEYWYDALKNLEKESTGRKKKEVHSWVTFLDLSLPHRGSDGMLSMLKKAWTMLTDRQIVLPELCVTANAPSMINGGKDFSEWTKHDKEIATGMGKILSSVLGKYGPGLIELGLAESYFEKGADLYEVIRLASKGQIQAESHGKLEQEFVAAGMIARVHVMSGHVEDARFMVERFEEQARKGKGEKLIANIYNLYARFYLYQGEKVKIDEWMKQAPDEMGDFWTFDRYQYLTKIRVYILYGKYEQAELLIEKISYYAQVMHRTYISMECELLLSILQYRRGYDQWEKTFQEAYRKIEEYSFVRLITREGIAVQPLLKKAQLEIKDKKFHKQVLEETARMAQYYPSYLKEKKHGDSSFSENAIAILRYQAEGLSNEKIAKQMNMTVSNVKYHCSQTYKKLGVSGKAAAVMEARKRRLI